MVIPQLVQKQPKKDVQPEKSGNKENQKSRKKGTESVF